MKKRITKDPEDRKREIIKSATTIFLDKGYEKTSVEDIARQVNIVKGAVYYYFDSKESIFEAVVSEVVDDIFDFNTKCMENELNAVDKFNKLLNNIYFYLAKQDLDTINLFLFGNELIRSRFLKVVSDRITELFLKIVKQGIEEKSFSCQHPEKMTSILVNGVLYNAVEMYRLNMLEEEHTAFIDITIDMFNSLLSTEELKLEIGMG